MSSSPRTSLSWTKNSLRPFRSYAVFGRTCSVYHPSLNSPNGSKSLSYSISTIYRVRIWTCHSANPILMMRLTWPLFWQPDWVFLHRCSTENVSYCYGDDPGQAIQFGCPISCLGVPIPKRVPQSAGTSLKDLKAKALVLGWFWSYLPSHRRPFSILASFPTWLLLPRKNVLSPHSYFGILIEQVSAP